MRYLYLFIFGVLINLYSQVKAETLTFEDFIFDIDNLRGKQVNVESYFLMGKDLGMAWGRIITEDRSSEFNIEIKLEKNKWKEAYNHCKNLDNFLGNRDGKHLYYCGFTNVLLQVDFPLPMGVRLKDITFIRDY